MNITSIHLKLLKCLEHDSYSLKELSLILGISESILRRNLKDLEDILGFSNILKNNEKILLSNNKITAQKDNTEFLIEERKAYIILKLLFNELINLTELSTNLRITRRTIAYDIKSLKNDIEIFDLKIESLNSIGIKLIGDEINKRKVFELCILKFLRDLDYLPKPLRELLNEVKKVIEFKGVVQIVKNILDYLNLPSSGLFIRHLEILTAISIIRKDIVDSSLNEKKLNSTNKPNFKIKEYIDNISFFTHYEREAILFYCSLKDYENILNNEKEALRRMENLLSIINLEFKCNLKLDKELITKLYSILKSYDFKIKFKIKEFYLYNKTLSNDSFFMFEKIKKIILKNFKGIDSFDLMVLSIIFLELINKSHSSKNKEFKNLTIVYNFLNPLIIDDLCKKLKIEKIMNKSNYVYINHLEDYLKNNSVECFLIFEDIDLSISNLPIIKLTLPISFEDYLKLNYIKN